MAVRSTTDQASFLLSRKVAEAKQRGAMAPDVEALALFESIALNLLLHPRVSLLFAMLAKNGLRQKLQQELDQIAVVRSAILDLNNTSLAITSTTHLQTARTSLLQLEQLGRVSSEGIQFQRFDTAIGSFLTSISKSVKTSNGTLKRPGTEAASDLNSGYSALLGFHTDLLDRLYALVVGVRNFLSSPLSTIIGLTTAARARSDIEDLITEITSTPNLAANRDMVIRLITNRASLKVIGTTPSVTDPLLSTDKSLPIGYSVKGRSDPAPAILKSTPGPFVLPAAAQATLTVNSTSLGPFTIPQTTFDLNNKASVASISATYPVVVAAGYYLFITVDGIAYKIGPMTTGSRSLAQIITELNSKFTAITPISGLLHAAEFINAGTSRLLIYHDTATSLSINNVFTGLNTDPNGGGTSVTYDGTVYVNNINSLVGFNGSEVGNSGATPTEFVLDAFSRLFSSLATVEATENDTITLTSLDTSPGVSMNVTAPLVLGMSVASFGQSDLFKLYGTVNGETLDPVSPVGLMDIGDIVRTPNGTASVVGITADRIRLSVTLITFDGSVTIDSALTVAYTALDTGLTNFLALTWTGSDFAINLNKLSFAVTSLGSNISQSQRNVVLSQLADLESRLTVLTSLLDDDNTVLAGPSAQAERAIVDGITSSLAERKFDKALDLFLKCKIQEALDSTADTASFAGALIKAASDFAQKDLVVPNRALDESVESRLSQDNKGL